MNFIKIIRERKIIRGSLYSRYFIDSKGNLVGIPLGVSFATVKSINYVKNNNSPFKNYPGFVSCCIPYHDAESQETAILKMIRINGTLSQDAVPTAPKADKPRARSEGDVFRGFDMSRLPSGVSIHYLVKCNRMIFSVSYFDEQTSLFRNKQIYIGTRNTWSHKLESALEKALELRKATLERFNGLTNRETEHA